MKKQEERRLAYEILVDVERGAYANLALKEALKKNPTAKADFVTALVYTTLDHQITLDFYLNDFSTKRIPLPIRCLLRLGLAQMLYMNVPARAAINESVSLCKSIGKAGTSGFVNGILRTIERSELPMPMGTQVERLSIEYSYPPFLVDLFINQWGEEGARAMMATNNQRESMLCIHANPIRSSEQEVDALFPEAKRGYFVSNARYIENYGNIAENAAFQAGKIAIQGESAMLVGLICEPKKGQSVLDVCAAPGGKTTHIAGLMREGHIDAWDIHPHRVKLIEKNCARLGIDFVQAIEKDATAYDPSCEGKYDLVLADVPCSGLGVLQSKPDIRYAKSKEDIDALVEVQRTILKNASQYVAKNGTLVYATCTVTKQENEENIDWFLKNHPDYELSDFSHVLPSDFDKKRWKRGQLQLLPSLDGVDGFYMARMVRRS